MQICGVGSPILPTWVGASRYMERRPVNRLTRHAKVCGVVVEWSPAPRETPNSFTHIYFYPHLHPIYSLSRSKTTTHSHVFKMMTFVPSLRERAAATTSETVHALVSVRHKCWKVWGRIKRNEYSYDMVVTRYGHMIIGMKGILYYGLMPWNDLTNEP